MSERRIHLQGKENSMLEPLTGRLITGSRFSVLISDGEFRMLMVSCLQTFVWYIMSCRFNPNNTEYATRHRISRKFELQKEEKGRTDWRNRKGTTLANRTTDSKQEMDALDALRDIHMQRMKRASRAVGGSACTNKFIRDRRQGDSMKRKESR